MVELKKVDEGDIMGAWGGISTLGLGLSLLWTEGKKRGISIGKILEWTSGKTAEHAALSGRKAKLEVGYDADFVIWDPEAQHTVSTDERCLCSLLTHIAFTGYERISELQE